MAQRGRSSGDFLEDYHISKDRIRRLELRTSSGGGKTLTTHNFLVSGPVGTGFFVPTAYLFNESWQSVSWTASGYYCHVGSVTVDMVVLRGSSIFHDPIGMALQNGDQIQPIITDASGAEDLTAWYALTKVAS